MSLIYPIIFHLRKLIFPFPWGRNCKQLYLQGCNPVFTSLSFGTLCSLNLCRFYVFFHGLCEFICALALLCLEYIVSLESLTTSASYNRSACDCGSLFDFFSHIVVSFHFLSFVLSSSMKIIYMKFLDRNASNLSFSVQCLPLYLCVNFHLLKKEASLMRVE